MAISVADNFSYKGSKPLDARIQYSTVANMKNAAASDLYDGCLAYVTEAKKNYQYDSTNSVNPTTGKWRELQTGGGGGEGGHTIEDNGTEMTQRDALNFVDFDLEDDDTNEKTVVQSHELTQEEFSEIFSTLPTMSDRSTVSNEANNLSLSEKVIGTWVDGKPLYQKTIDFVSNLVVAYNDWTLTGITLSNVNDIIKAYGTSLEGPYQGDLLANIYYNDELRLQAVRNGINASVRYVTLQYTKTTDSAVSSGEKIVGQWIDGKPIYQKALNIQSPNVSWQSQALSLIGVDSIVFQSAIGKRSNGSKITEYFRSTSDCFDMHIIVATDGTTSYYCASSSPLTDIFLTVQYTKLSD